MEGSAKVFFLNGQMKILRRHSLNSENAGFLCGINKTMFVSSTKTNVFVENTKIAHFKLTIFSQKGIIKNTNRILLVFIWINLVNIHSYLHIDVFSMR